MGELARLYNEKNTPIRRSAVWSSGSLRRTREACSAIHRRNSGVIAFWYFWEGETLSMAVRCSLTLILYSRFDPTSVWKGCVPKLCRIVAPRELTASWTVEPAIGTLHRPVILPVTEKLDPRYISMKVQQANFVSSGDTPIRLGSGAPRYSLQYDSQRLQTLSLLSSSSWETWKPSGTSCGKADKILWVTISFKG